MGRASIFISISIFSLILLLFPSSITPHLNTSATVTAASASAPTSLSAAVRTLSPSTTTTPASMSPKDYSIFSPKSTPILLMGSSLQRNWLGGTCRRPWMRLCFGLKGNFNLTMRIVMGSFPFSEYVLPTWVMAAGNGSLGHDLGWWDEEHFNASDTNGDGVLDITEYNEEKDADKDGKLNFSEFFRGIFDLVRKNDENNHLSTRDDDATEELAKKIFSDLDIDYDGYLLATELLPVIGKIHLSEAYYAKQQAEYIISQVDSDDDGFITLDDMIENPSVFYSTVFSEDEMDYYPYHDEFR